MDSAKLSVLVLKWNEMLQCIMLKLLCLWQGLSQLFICIECVLIFYLSVK